jgi:hypothetical protein
MACNMTEVQVNGITTYAGVSCRTPDDWQVDCLMTVKRGRRRYGVILADHLPTERAAWDELGRIKRDGWNGEIK